jgi:alkanesulfonate monooxygenase SsuD/methylene tetrahydromethanopterin reductase-like flavin-dependent oxidoreductase (luciferase family)
MPSPFPNAGESEEDAAKRFSQESSDVAPEWMSKQAAVIEIKHGTGHMVSFARGSEDGKTVWRESQAMRPSQPNKNARAWTPEDLLEALRESLGG